MAGLAGPICPTPSPPPPPGSCCECCATPIQTQSTSGAPLSPTSRSSSIITYTDVTFAIRDFDVDGKINWVAKNEVTAYVHE
ncbi:unnamed protein product [Dovyalis caffra]|uniref:Uncharacterized protein n=1 Tax=Dovyalis caffra TaxID=77055 RepID=A0AAV1SVG0_9ROSI|nr:unnamed protein product [Dovyalis caffra]